MFSRSRSHVVSLVSSLSLILTLGAATVANCSNSRYRNARQSRIVREVDTHGFDSLTTDTPHDRGTGSHVVAGSGRTSDPPKDAPAAIPVSITFSADFSRIVLPLNGDQPLRSSRNIDAPDARGPPSA